MIVVAADTSPLNYLVPIEAVEVLQQLYQRIFVPEAVITELRSSDAPLQVQQWAASLPPWVAVRGVPDELLTEPRWQALPSRRTSGLGAGDAPQGRSGSHGRANGRWRGAEERASCDWHFGNTGRGGTARIA